MEYASHQVSKMSGVSARTLRHYDAIGLLRPARVAASGYRLYGPDELSRLQQILLYRELEFPLGEIKSLLSDPDFNRERAFLSHLAQLEAKRARLDRLIGTVKRSLSAMKGEVNMTDTEQFEGFKQALIDQNERQYGAEIREKYGEEEVEAANARVKGLTPAQYEESVKLSQATDEALKAAMAAGDPAGPLAQKACDLHRRWLCVFYPHYTKAYHRGLGEMYAADPRFKAYYERVAPGCAEFLRDAIEIYCKE